MQILQIMEEDEKAKMYNVCVYSWSATWYRQIH